MSILKNEKVVIKPVEENIAAWIPEGKDGRVNWENTSKIYDVPMTSSGVAKILTKEEQEFLEQEIDNTRTKGWLSPYAKVQGVWTGKGRYQLEIPSSGIELDLNNPLDYIKYKIACSISEDIAPTYAEREHKKYIFYMEFKSNTEKTTEEKIDKLMRANAYFNDIKDSRSKMRNLWLLINKGSSSIVPLDITTIVLKTRLFEYINERTNMFLTIIDAEDLEYKIAYYRALETGTFEQNGLEIRASGKVIGTSMNDCIIYIKEIKSNVEDQKTYLEFANRLKY